VVVFAPSPVAALDDADGLVEQQRHSLGHSGSSAEVGEVDDVDPAGDHQLEDAFAQ
jgi:hypothetical protein